MHELSLVAELVKRCAGRAAGRPVLVVRVRCADATEPDELQLAFAELSPGSGLGGAVLEVELVPTTLACPCGFDGVVEPAACSGQAAVCPDCGSLGRAGPGLELRELVIGSAQPPG